MVVIVEPKIFYFDFDWPKDDRNLKLMKIWIDFIIRSNRSLAEIKIKSEIEQLLLKYNHGNDIHEQGKKQNEWTTKDCS